MPKIPLYGTDINYLVVFRRVVPVTNARVAQHLEMGACFWGVPASLSARVF